MPDVDACGVHLVVEDLGEGSMNGSERDPSKVLIIRLLSKTRDSWKISEANAHARDQNHK